MIGLDYKDTIYILDPVLDEYGSEKIGRLEEVQSLFIQRTGYDHSDNEADITSDAVAYLDPANSFLQEVSYGIQGMLINAGYAEDVSDEWYRISDVTIAQDKLLSNQIEHIKISLKKTAPIGYVS